jgi:hypothetical protein
VEASFHPKKCAVWGAVSNKGLIRPIFVRGTVTNKWYPHKLKNEVIPVIQGTGRLGTTHFQQEDAVLYI